MKTLSVIWAIVITAVTTIASASADEPARLEINSPFAGVPESLDADSSGSRLISTSSSRSITLWTRTGDKTWQPLTLKAPYRNEFAAGAYVGAIAPDAKYIAFGVPPLANDKGGYQLRTAQIYILDGSDLHIMATLSQDIPTKVMKLSFSPDGEHLGAILGNGCGYRIWAREQWTAGNKEIEPKWKEDTGYADEAGATNCPANSNLDALPSGRDLIFTGAQSSEAPWLLTVSENGLRSYVRSGDAIVQTGFLSRSAIKLTQPHSLAINPSDGSAAIGDTWGPRVAVLRKAGTKYEFEKLLEIPEDQLSPIGKQNAALGYTFLPNPIWVKQGDKTFVYAFGYFQPYNLANGDQGDESNTAVLFDYAAGVAPRLIRLNHDADSSLAVLKRPGSDGERLLLISTNELAATELSAGSDTDHPFYTIARRSGLDLRGRLPFFSVLLNAKDKQIYVPVKVGDRRYRSVTFDYGAMKISALKEFDDAANFEQDWIGHGEDQGFYNATAKPQEWGFERRILDEPAPKFFDVPLSRANISGSEVAYSGAEVEADNQVIWGTDRNLRVIDGKGNVSCVRPIESSAWRMNLTNDRRMVLVAHGDGVLRWYRLETGARCLPLVASLYLFAAGEGRWGFLAWLPNGKFMTDGLAGFENVACYPVARPNALPACIDFQRTNALFDRQAVLDALANATSTEGETPSTLVQAVASKEEKRQSVSFRLQGDYQTNAADYPLSVTIDGLPGAANYLAFVGGSSIDLEFRSDQGTYSASKPMPLPKSGTYNVVLEIPEVLHHAGKSFVVCPSVYSRLLPTGIVDPSSVLKPTADSYCSNVAWTGADSPNPTKRKLWAVLVGFSGSSHLAAPALQFAHEDAINFARFLQLEASRELPGATGGSAPNPYFDDIAMRLLVSSPSLSNNQSIAQNAKIKELQKFGDAKFVVVYPQAGDNYKDLVAQSINDVFKDITVFQRTHADDGIDWQHAILVYFSGHGFSQKDEQDPQTPYMRTGLVTPSSKNDLENGSIWVDELLKQLLGSRYLSIVIVDACRGPADQSAALPFDSQLANLSAYPHLNIDAQRNQIHILYSSQVGHYSYEASQYDVADFVPQLKLWPPAIGTKGGGLFSLGLLSSLMCEDALQGDPNFTLQNAKDFLRRYFFSQSNAKWRDIEAQLKTDLANRKLVYTKPDPAYDPFGSPDRAVLREGTAKAPKCFSAASQ